MLEGVIKKHHVMYNDTKPGNFIWDLMTIKNRGGPPKMDGLKMVPKPIKMDDPSNSVGLDWRIAIWMFPYYINEYFYTKKHIGGS